MTGTKHFGDVTHWGRDSADGGAGGWYRPGADYFIRPGDPCWDRVLDEARKTYGDPNIRYDTNDIWSDRHLVFGDGSKLPEDGTVVYHDAASKQNWAQNEDGTTSLVGPDGKLGAPIAPAGYRKIGDQYAPVNGTGQQVAPQLGGIPSSNSGFYTDPKTGVLTPKNGNGDYYTFGPDGKKSCFDKSGAPITEQQYDNANGPRPPGAPAPDAAGLPTDEQQSGNAADAVKKLQDELKARFTTISAAEEKLSEVLLNAHATTADGQAKLNDIQKKIVEAVNNPAMETKTAAGEKAYLMFLRSQVSAIKDLLASSSLSAEDQSKAAQALAGLYAAESDDTTTGPGDPGANGSPAPGQPAAAPAVPDVSADPGFTDPGLGLAPEMPDPSLSDVMGGMPMGGLGADPMSSLASMLPGALGSLGGGGGSPLDALSGLAGAASPLAGLASGLGDQGSNDRQSDTIGKPDDKTDPVKDDKYQTDPAKNDTTVPRANQPQTTGQQDSGLPAQPPAPVVPPAPASPTVNLPDGSTANARTPQAAQAVRDYLAGGTVDAAYRQNGMTLPPVGTPVTNPVDPTRLACGDIAMFKDHYEPLLSSIKGYLNGQVVPLSQVTSSPDFLGFIDPTAMASAGSTASGAPVPAPAVPASPLAAPVTGPAAAPIPTG
jgi:hypothetical protein